jgi:PAS domain S-box-containing protein
MIHESVHPIKATILAVDDTPANLHLLAKMLSKQAYKLRIIADCEQALSSAQAYPPDLILLDILMPQMDGYEVCSKLKADERTKNIPVIFISALNEGFDKVKAFEVGGVDYITKPFIAEEVIARVENQLRLKAQEKQLLEQNARLTSEIEERKLAEEKLKKSEANLIQAQRVAHVGDWEFDVLTGKITWSEEKFRIFGLDSALGEPSFAELLEIIHPDDRELFQESVNRAIAQGVSYEIDFRIRQPNGEVRYIESRGEAVFNDSGQVIQLFGTVLDITERKQREEALQQSEAREREKAIQLELTLRELKHTQSQLIQAEKMSALGRMVAGVAHEINNPVNFISGNLTYARNYFQDLLSLVELYQQTFPVSTPEIQRLLSEIELDFLVEDWSKLTHSMQVGAERIQEIVQSLKLFSRLDEAELKPTDIHEGIDNTLLILQHRLRAVGNAGEIEVIKDYSQLPLITCYASQLNQVFMNLLSNAIDALENQPSPRAITIRTETGQEARASRQEADEKLSPRRSHPSPEFVVIRIADNGTGMSEEVKQKIFDPFFTTKPVGSGTGLGLSISHQIVVEKHLGHISCVSTPGQGTEFIVEIPVSQEYSLMDSCSSKAPSNHLVFIER